MNVNVTYYVESKQNLKLVKKLSNIFNFNEKSVLHLLSVFLLRTLALF